MNRTSICLLLSCLAWLAVSDPKVHAQTDFEKEPINYYTAPVDDPVARLKAALEAGDEKLDWDDKSGWLKSVLEKLDVPVSSQTLVFSKTSLQLSRITPAKPRALYFNDDVYIGWVQQGDVLELSAVDRNQGAIFYTLSQSEQPEQPPVIKRDQGHCAVCHASSRTKGVPGFLIRSVYVGRSGTPLYGLGTKTTDHSTPIEDRFGGWYVTGTHGQMRHLGNSIATQGARPPLDVSKGANVTNLKERVKTDPYLTDTSDIVAMMVLEHQSQMHNLITRANYESRRCVHQDKIMNRLLEREEDFQSDSSRRRIASAGDELLEYMLFKEEFALTSPIKGSSAFQREFETSGKGDSQGRSLRQFDLQTRLFKYPCSFLIYSDAYQSLPGDMKNYVEGRLAKILSDEDETGDFDYLDSSSKKAIREILSETLTGFADRLSQI